MRIFQVINVRWFNATAWYAITLSRLLADAGHEVLVLTQADTDAERAAKALGLTTVSVDLNTTNPVRFARAIGHIIQLLRAHRPEIVNCHRGEGFFLWGLLKLAGFRFKLVRTRGDQRPPRCDAFNRWLHANAADAVVVTNRFMADYFLKRMRTPPKGVWLIQGGVDTERFAFDPEGREAVRAEFGFGPDDLVVGLLGRFDRVKGHRELIRAVARLRAEGLANVRLFLIGFDTAMTRSEIEADIEAAKVGDITRISGRRDDVAACVSALDVGVVASLWSEAIARSALEIMAAGRPLVSTSVGVMPDLVSPPALVAPGDEAALARAIAEVTKPEVRAEVLDRQKRIMSQLTLEEFLKRSLNLYSSLLDG
ncbi:glycosyltransferase family 4 protein [Pseudodesulfovibrio sp.]|uniref:glycosyltransferase family 4 protein n=1 Tax=Pseudodesulfovibrio sp. TaxID=2035812 RepID=UPI002632B60B|nr:glycosyltransferase family 4 protein [Pseudodesulfovibrio sp.]MDD3312194.1 glycosyltransferase family 4 protein [Pseudodesulfovibrio sp.]